MTKYISVSLLPTRLLKHVLFFPLLSVVSLGDKVCEKIPVEPCPQIKRTHAPTLCRLARSTSVAQSVHTVQCRTLIFAITLEFMRLQRQM